jgi:hypothetical protein
MRNRLCAAVAVLAFSLFALGLASASITGSISGVVTDTSGAVISGASVVVIDTQTGITTTVTTDAKGSYSLLTLAIGTYDLEIRLVGFKTYQKKGGLSTPTQHFVLMRFCRSALSTRKLRYAWIPCTWKPRARRWER